MAPAGNQNGVKLKDPDVRQQAFEQYCAHIGKGKSKKSFVFRHPELTCTYKTLDKYIEDNPAEFPPLQIECAKAEGYAEWEQVVEDSARGINKEANTASLQMLMRNKFDWDLKEKDHDVSADKKLSILGEFFAKIRPQPKPEVDKESPQSHN